MVCENYARSTDAAMSLGRMADTVGDNKSSTTPLSTYSPKNICHTLLEEEKSQKGWFMREERGETLHLSFAVDYFKLNEPAHLNAITESVLWLLLLELWTVLLPLSTVVDINLELDHPQLYFFFENSID